jgi:outer membrane protein assembly factor BamA
MKPWRLFLLASHAILVALAVIFAAGTFAMAQAQSPVEHSKVIIDVVELEGTRLPKASQEELVRSLKQREWEEGSDWVADLEHIVIRADEEGWPDRENQGYLGLSVSAWWKLLRREPGLLHVCVTVHVDEGPPRKLEKIEFRWVDDHLRPTVFEANDLRKLIPLKDGEIYNRDKYHAGVDAVATAYAERGFVGLTTYETLALDDDNHTVALAIEITKGVRYRWGNIQVSGLDPKIETIFRARLPKGRPVNPKLIRDFYQEYKSSLPLGASPETVEWKRNPQRNTVDLTFDFSTPPAEAVHD